MSLQSMEMLAEANVVRYQRKVLRARAAAPPKLEGRDLVARYLLEQPACLASMTVAALLAWPRRDSPVSAARTLEALPWPTRISEGRLVGTLVDRERRALAAVLTCPQRVIDLVAEVESERRAA